MLHMGASFNAMILQPMHMQELHVTDNLSGTIAEAVAASCNCSFSLLITSLPALTTQVYRATMFNFVKSS